MPTRTEYYLTEYFRNFEKSEREKIKYFVSDMWKPFANIGSVWFGNAEQNVDKYHWIRQIFWAFESVRKEEQRKFSKSYRKYFKIQENYFLKDLMN